MIKKLTMCIAVMMSFVVANAGDLISGFTARQRYPWSDSVDVDFTVNRSLNQDEKGFLLFSNREGQYELMLQTNKLEAGEYRVIGSGWGGASNLTFKAVTKGDVQPVSNFRLSGFENIEIEGPAIFSYSFVGHGCGGCWGWACPVVSSVVPLGDMTSLGRYGDNDPLYALFPDVDYPYCSICFNRVHEPGCYFKEELACGHLVFFD